MKSTPLFIALTIFALATLTAYAQERVMRLGGPEGKAKIIKGDIFDIPELGALIVKSDNGLKVEHVMPAEARPKAYADVDVKSNDLILLVNGKRVKTIKEIEKQYNDVSVGGEVKLGLQRGEEMLISRFAKADPMDLPQRKMMIIKSDGLEGDIHPLPGLGVILGKGKGGVVVKDVMENAAKPLSDAHIKSGDRIVSIDGTQVKTLEDFAKLFEAVWPGGNMTWVINHGGKEVSVTFSKPESRGNVIIRREQK